MDVSDSKTFSRNIIICVPVFNDWESVLIVIEQLDRHASMISEAVSVLLVDDGSTDPAPETLPQSLSHIKKVEVLRLHRNIGHQRAIAMGLSFIHAERPCQAVVVMDGDGEDNPGDVKTLVECCRNTDFSKVIMAKRTRRSEGIVFRLGYAAYKMIHYLLTGIRVEVGNFSIVPYKFLNSLMVVSELWNHYAAAVFVSKLPLDMTPMPRGNRIKGSSTMDFTQLVVHGLSAISVFGDKVGVRLLWIISLLMLFPLAGLLITFSIKLFTDLAIPGWATNLTGFLIIIFFNLILLTTFSLLLMLNSREKLSFLPIRDWKYFVDDCRTIYG